MHSLFLYFQALIMGIVEGVTEFLPISSTGHMIIVGQFIKFDGAFAKLFEIVIQFGAILAIVVLYRKKLINSLKTLQPGGYGFRLWLAIIVALVPAGIVAVIEKVLGDPIEKFMMDPRPVAGALIVGAVWMLFAEHKYRKNDQITHAENISLPKAFAIGIFQCISIVWPGFSRSASTIIGGWIMGLSTAAAAEFSFFLAIPAMFGASAGSLLKSHIKLTSPEIVALLIGFVTAFFVALVVVKKFLDFIKHKPLKGFAYYRLAVGALIAILAVVGLVK